MTDALKNEIIARVASAFGPGFAEMVNSVLPEVHGSLGHGQGVGYHETTVEIASASDVTQDPLNECLPQRYAEAYQCRTGRAYRGRQRQPPTFCSDYY